jgi:cholest-4-en-3-one 26-monooxygenase
MRHTVSADLQDLARLDEPGFYAGNPYPVFERLRQEAPVYWYEPGQFWAVTRYADVAAIELDNRSYSISRQGNRLADRRGTKRFNSGGGPTFTTDPPDHSKYRRLASRAFTPRLVAGLEPMIRELAASLLAGLPDSAPADFVVAVAEPLPIYVLAAVLGLPRSDWEQLKRWSDVRIAIFDAPSGSEQERGLLAELADYFCYLEARVVERRRSPREDLISAIAASEEISQPLQVSIINSLVVAGNETTRSTLACAAAALAEFPGEWAKLKSDAALASSAAEEVLRWATPIIHFARTAVCDATLGGQRIRDGDFVVMLYPSANLDAEVWDDADAFDISRSVSAAHMSFGLGIHFCLGASLARLEISVTIQEMLRQFATWQSAGPAERLPSTHVNQYAHVPVVAARPSPWPGVGASTERGWTNLPEEPK